MLSIVRLAAIAAMTLSALGALTWQAAPAPSGCAKMPGLVASSGCDAAVSR